MIDRRHELAAALKAVAAGDRAALETVYSRTSAKLLGIVIRIVRNRERAEEVLQDVYLKVWRKAGTFDDAKGSPITWLAVVARNAALNEMRRSPDGSEGADVVLPEIADDTCKPADEWLCDAEDSAALADCLDTLQPDHRRSIVMAFFDGLSHSELAQRTDVPLGTLKSWIRRGLAKLRGCLDGR